MYRRPKFLEVLLAIRQEMARESDYDVDLFTETVRSGGKSKGHRHSLAENRNGTEERRAESGAARRPGNKARKP